MPQTDNQIQIDYRRTDAGLLVFLDKRSRTRMQGEIEANRQRAPILREEGLPGEAAACLIVAAGNEQILKNDEELRKAGDVQTAVFEHREPTKADQKAIRAVLDDGGKVQDAQEKAYELLQPKAVSGWEGEPPLKMIALLEENCLSAVLINLTDDQLFFTHR